LTILAGIVYDEEGATVDGATVTVKSLDTRAPFTGTATTASGSYTINNVPVGAQIDVTVTKAGWTTRRRVTSLQDRVTDRNTLDFGGVLAATNAEDPAGASFFVSNFPEIQSATPGASPIAGDKLSYKVRFSEPLDEDNRDLVNSFEISSAAIGRPLIPTAQATGQRIIVQEGSSLFDNSRKTAFIWNAEGTEFSMTFDAPLRADDNEDKTYTFRLIRRNGDDVIEDNEGKFLGFAETAVTASYNAIKRSNLALDTTSKTSQAIWNDTHNQSTGFDVKEDDTDPKLVGVKTSKTTIDGLEFRRISLTFSEPMRVYPDAHGYAQSLIDLSNYSFAFSEDRDLKGTDMDDPAQTYNLTDRVAADLRDGSAAFYEKPLRITNLSAERVHPSNSNPNVLEIDILDAEFPSQLKTLRVKAETTVTDPAGNKMSEKGESADKLADNVVEGSF